MQSQMGGFIKTKMPLQLEFERLKEALASFENEEGDRKKKSVSIDWYIFYLYVYLTKNTK